MSITSATDGGQPFPTHLTGAQGRARIAGDTTHPTSLAPAPDVRTLGWRAWAFVSRVECHAVITDRSYFPKYARGARTLTPGRLTRTSSR